MPPLINRMKLKLLSERMALMRDPNVVPMTQKLMKAAVKAAIKEAIETHPEYAADRIAGLVFDASTASVRETAKEIGHSWPKPRKAYMPVSRMSSFGRTPTA
jgi:hypothetical protein